MMAMKIITLMMVAMKLIVCSDDNENNGEGEGHNRDDFENDKDDI